jgi:hypothetical protein
MIVGGIAPAARPGPPGQADRWWTRLPPSSASPIRSGAPVGRASRGTTLPSLPSEEMFSTKFLEEVSPALVQWKSGPIQ